MSENDPNIRTRMRSPAYPVIGLRKAIDLSNKLWMSIRKSEAHVDSALSAMGYARHGESLRIIAALGHYGLIDESGAKDARRVRLSERAQDILHLADGDARKNQALKDAALAPAIHAELWERYGATLLGATAIKPFLVRDKGFNDTVVDDVIANYLDAFEVANLGKMPEDDAAGRKVENVIPPPGGGIPAATAKHPQTMQLNAEPNLSGNVLPILIGDNRQASIPFPMTEDDFDLMIGTLNLWKKKIVRAVMPPPVAAQRTYPARAIWKNKDNDKPVVLAGFMGTLEGRIFHRSEDGTGIPDNELSDWTPY